MRTVNFETDLRDMASDIADHILKEINAHNKTARKRRKKITIAYFVCLVVGWSAASVPMDELSYISSNDFAGALFFILPVMAVSLFTAQAKQPNITTLPAEYFNSWVNNDAVMVYRLLVAVINCVQMVLFLFVSFQVYKEFHWFYLIAPASLVAMIALTTIAPLLTVIGPVNLKDAKNAIFKELLYEKATYGSTLLDENLTTRDKRTYL